MSMTRKDFVNLAYSLWSARMDGRLTDSEADKTCAILKPGLYQSNPRFDYDKFRNAVLGEKMP